MNILQLVHVNDTYLYWPNHTFGVIPTEFYYYMPVLSNAHLEIFQT